MKRRRREVSKIVARMHSDYSIRYSSAGHMRITLHNGRNSRHLITPSSPSCNRIDLNLKRDIRKTIKELKAKN